MTTMVSACHKDGNGPYFSAMLPKTDEITPGSGGHGELMMP